MHIDEALLIPVSSRVRSLKYSSDEAMAVPEMPHAMQPSHSWICSRMFSTCVPAAISYHHISTHRRHN